MVVALSFAQCLSVREIWCAFVLKFDDYVGVQLEMVSALATPGPLLSRFWICSKQINWKIVASVFVAKFNHNHTGYKSAIALVKKL
jgi:hypothetical protein